MTVDWGTVPDWVNVGVTASALTAAVLAGRTAHRALRLEQRRQTIAEERDEASQAATVAAWVKTQTNDKWDAVLRNGSDLPVYDVEVTFRSDEEEGLGPATQTFEVVGPGDTDLGYPPAFTWPAPPVVTHLVPGIRLSLSFTDASGVPWHRDEHGRLQCIRGHDSPGFLRGPLP